MDWPWNELGLPGPSDGKTVKHAYAQRLKEVHPEEDPEGFQKLHQAYIHARRLAALVERGEPIPPPPEPPCQEELLCEPLSDRIPTEDSWNFEELLREEEEADWEEPEPDWKEPYAAPPPSSEAFRRLRYGFLCGLCGLCFMLIASILMAHFTPNTDQRNARQLLEYLETDFSVELVSSPNNQDRENDIYLFWEEDNPKIRFQANLEGERDMEAGTPGYRTNYTDAKFYRAIRNFLLDWPEYPVWYDIDCTDPDGEEMAEHAAPQGYYIVSLPLEGADSFLRAFGNCLTQLSQEEWFVTDPPQVQLDFLHGDVVVLEYLSTEDPLPNGAELVQEYAENLGPTMLRALLTDYRVASWDYPDLDEVSILRQGNEGVVMDDSCWWVTCYGIDLFGQAKAMYYFLSKDFTKFYAISQADLEGEGENIVLEGWDPVQLDCGCEIAVWRSKE